MCLATQLSYLVILKLTRALLVRALALMLTFTGSELKSHRGVSGYGFTGVMQSRQNAKYEC